MSRAFLSMCLAVLVSSSAWADKPKEGDKPKAAADSLPVAGTRKKLEQAVTVKFTDESLRGVIKELESKAEVKFHPMLGAGVSGNTSFTYAAKDKPLKDVLDELFKDRGLGYVIHRAEKVGDRYEGWIRIVQGDERGDPIPPKIPKAETKPKPDPKEPPKPDPKPGDSDEKIEKIAGSKLSQAKVFFESGQLADAKKYCEQILADYPKTKAAAGAKELLEKLNKKP